MNNYFGYIRVSTAKQGVHGVSLQEQRDAIERCAKSRGFTISDWFEERETAAKQGRALFSDMLTRLRKGEARGIVMHKVDRSARNMRDWADVDALIDGGYDVIFANTQLDLSTRAGRLCANIEAVVAADYSRNLREEAKKGIYGRLKQGCFPFQAPLGYRNMGAGQPKQLDERTAPLVKEAFRLYATGRYNLDTLGQVLYDTGLRNQKGGGLSRGGLATLLKNPFYVGVIQIKTTNEVFQGKHPALIDHATFKRVQEISQGRVYQRPERHAFLFRRMFSCQHCKRFLVGELQKGHVYYRCHGRNCPGACVREEAIKAQLEAVLCQIAFTDTEQQHLLRLVGQEIQDEKQLQDLAEQHRRHRLDDTEARLNRLTDALVDGTIEKEVFAARKKALLLERRELEDAAAQSLPVAGIGQSIRTFLELSKSVLLTYQSADDDEKRELVEIVSSNRTVSGKNVSITLRTPFDLVANRPSVNSGGPLGVLHRTLLKQLIGYFTRFPDTAMHLDRFVRNE